ncbi:N-acetyl-D-Glu racemase DgcA [Novispirillum sp. DQ9]|uniref:N-acetyl-D-Glu racemase DgcA n=1 Tax=Novispirillum sp. DQ9 TaxID=3398612 RepID=UPI003C7D7B4B
MRRLAVRAERWPIAGAFTISRGSKTAAEVVVAEVTDGDGRVGRGECVPYARYGETVAAVMAALEALAGAVADGLDRAGLAARLPAGAARNALDCALWDLEARQARQPVWRLAGLPRPAAVETAETLSLDTAEAMAAKAVTVAGRLIKLKVGSDGVLERVAAVHAAAPGARLIVDANEAWTLEQVAAWLPALAGLGVALVEQPLPAGADAGLAVLGPPAVPLCADESVHTAAGLEDLAGRYQVVNIKLDKTGGLTGALALRQRAEALGFGIMVGCMVGTSLGMAPALLVAQGAAFVDLDGPLMLTTDRPDGLRYTGGWVEPPAPLLWGGGI